MDLRELNPEVVLENVKIIYQKPEKIVRKI